MRRFAVRLRQGAAQTVAAILLAAGFTVVVLESQAEQTLVGARVTVMGAAFFVAALLIGSTRLVGLATLPALGGAFLALAAGPEPAWVRSILLGCLWYAATETAWDAIERRDGATRLRAFSARRINEVATVVTVAVGFSAFAFALSALAPTRNLFTVGIAILVVLIGLAAATRLLGDEPAP